MERERLRPWGLVRDLGQGRFADTSWELVAWKGRRAGEGGGGYTFKIPTAAGTCLTDAGGGSIVQGWALSEDSKTAHVAWGNHSGRIKGE